MKNNISTETQHEALKIAKATSRPNQTKEQTKIIAKGIEKGIAEYKKQQKAKARERDKAKKKTAVPNQDTIDDQPERATQLSQFVPWVLLCLSWLGFITYLLVLK
jgi:hypothetical protein